MNRSLTLLGGGLWLALIAAGSGVLMLHGNSAGRDAGLAALWPAQSHIPFSPGEPTLILFAHPQCPCTRASLTELELLLRERPGRARAFVVFLQPEAQEADWVRGELWQRARSLPGVTVLRDQAGQEAGAFKVTTSGHVLLYDARRRLQFSGGITASRGKEGGSLGLSALMTLLDNGTRAARSAPVFGCSLQDAESSQEKRKS